MTLSKIKFSTVHVLAVAVLAFGVSASGQKDAASNDRNPPPAAMTKEMTVEQKLDISRKMLAVRRSQVTVLQINQSLEKATQELNKSNGEYLALRDKLVKDGFAPKCKDEKVIPDLTEEATWSCPQ